MTKRQALLKTLRREKMTGFHSDIELTPSLLKDFRKKHRLRTVAGYFNLSHRYSCCFYKASYEGDGKHFFENQDIPEHFSVDPFGIGSSKGSDEALHMVHFHSPLAGEDTSLEQIENHPLPHFIPALKPLLKMYTGMTKLRGLATFASMEQTIWERAWLIRGMDNLMMDMMCDDPKATVLLDRITEHSCQSAALLAETGHDIIGLGDDVGMQSTLMMSPELWRKWLKPRLARVIQTIKAIKPEILIFYHSCGYIEPLIGDLVEIGVEILNPVQPECMDFKKIHSEFGHKLSFWGGIGTQTTFPFGTPADIEKRIEDLLEIAGDHGGLVIAPTHVLEPEVPWENIEAYRKMMKQT